MSYHCKYCDKSIELKSKNNLFKSLVHKFEKFIQTDHTVDNPNFFDIDKNFDVYITNHNKKIELYLVRADSKIDLQTLIPHNKTDFQYNISLINWKQ